MAVWLTTLDRFKMGTSGKIQQDADKMLTWVDQTQKQTRNMWNNAQRHYLAAQSHINSELVDQAGSWHRITSGRGQRKHRPRPIHFHVRKRLFIQIPLPDSPSWERNLSVLHIYSGTWRIFYGTKYWSRKICPGAKFPWASLVEISQTINTALTTRSNKQKKQSLCGE